VHIIERAVSSTGWENGKIPAIHFLTERANPRQCCPSTAYSSKTFSLTSPRRISISLITPKLVFHSTVVLAILSSQAHHILFMGSSPTYIRSALQMVPTKARLKFFKQKPMFSIHFLVVGMPFYSQYLQDAALDKVISQDLDGEELWTAEGLQIPMYHTENGG
jgi:hypothetical protein